LIDVLVVIVLVGTVAGSLTVLFSKWAGQSAQTLRERQVLGVAQALLNEVRMKPFTICDPPAVGAFTGGPPCQTVTDGLGPEAGESRYTVGNRFDGVSDYHNFTMPGPGCAGLCDMAGNVVNGAGSPLAGCSARVTTTAQAMPGIAAVDASGRPQALRIAVAVTCPGMADTVAEGMRVRHAPNSI
jgi:MSHA pilin protein MshD